MNVQQTASPDIQPFARQMSEEPLHPVLRPVRRTLPARRIADGLGWFSLGLGMAECLMPNTIARLAGIKAHAGMVRLIGVREMLSGLGIFLQRIPLPWLWTRVGGDVMDISLLFAAQKTNAARATSTLAALVGITALDALNSAQYTQQAKESVLHIQQSIAIQRSPAELYDLWSDLSQLPHYFPHLVSVETVSTDRSHWVARGPGGATISWDATINRDEPHHLIAWQTLKGSQVTHAGTVLFEAAPGDRGCILHVDLRYMPPAGVLGAEAAKVTGRAPEQMIHKDLLAFKHLLEVGEIPSIKGQPAGRASSVSVRYDVPPQL